MELAGRTALLTGATGGLGRAIAKALAGRGATLALSGRKRGGAGGAGRRAARRRPPRRSSPTSPSPAPPSSSPPRPATSTSSSPTPACPAPAGWRTSAPRRSSARCGSTSRRRCCSPRRSTRRCSSAARGHLVFVASLSGKAASPRTSDLQRDQVRPARLRPRPARRPRRRRASASRSSRPGFIREAGHVRRRRAPSRRRASAPRTPEQVADAARCEAIEADKVEVAVAPLLGSASLAHVGLVSPGIAVRAAERRGRPEGGRPTVADGHSKDKR